MAESSWVGDAIRAVLDGGSKLGLGGAAVVLVLFLLSGVAWFYIFRWLYKDRFTARGEVIEDQAKLIATKDQRIRDYEASISRLEENKTTVESKLSELYTAVKEAEPHIDATRRQNANLLVFSAALVSGLQYAIIIFLEFENLELLRMLVRVYGSVLREHNDHSSVDPALLHERLNDTERKLLWTWHNIEHLYEMRVETAGTIGIPRQFAAGAEMLHKEGSVPASVRREIRDEIMPILRRYEPRFAQRVQQQLSEEKPSRSAQFFDAFMAVLRGQDSVKKIQ